MRPRYEDLPDMDEGEAIQRGRHDPRFFGHYFCRRILHDGQLEWETNAEATINVLATGNRYGKTSQTAVRHIRRNFYKLGGEEEYVDENGVVDLQRWVRLKYRTVHTANLWDTCKDVWEDVLKIVNDSPRLQPHIRDMPKSLPPHVSFTNGARILFRPLGDHGEGIDGKSFYLVTIDEAGWIPNLEDIINNVGRARVADVQGMIDLVGTMKPGISRAFYRYANRAAISTGKRITFEHHDGVSYKPPVAA